MYKTNHLKTTSFFALSTLTIALFSSYSYGEEKLEEIKVTAENQVKQSLGSSLVTGKDLEKRPATNDISEVLRTMPGVNLTGNSSTGQRGNKRQIDIRGMGPENTLILVDGKPVTSRMQNVMVCVVSVTLVATATGYQLKRFEKLKYYVALQQYAMAQVPMGGVVNIITKPVTQ